MNLRYFCVLCMATGLVFLGIGFGVLPKAIAAQPSQANVEEEGEVLTRGPVHEAFAGTITFDPEPGIVAPKAPPEVIEELPPEQRPAGDNVAWIPGYWAWDDERDDFLWISGIWRNLPPGRQWVPGYWGQSGQDSQWTSGYWADASATETEYLAEPPASVEVGPSIAASSVDQNWIPGSWLWQQKRYAWRPGYWAAGQPNWVWIPAYYAWTPCGYVFVDGYYDYSVANRGMLFAPVYFNSRIHRQRRVFYSPRTVINPSVFASHLFLRPSFGHYYFGDYYGSNYSTRGYSPWYSYNSSRHGYDPFYAHQRWQNRGDGNWEQNVKANFQNLHDHEAARPPRTLAAQNALVASQAKSTKKSVLVATSLAKLAKSADSAQRLQAVNKEERQKLAQHGQDLQKYRQERQMLEAKAAVTASVEPSKPSKPTRTKLPKSPLVARSADQLGKNQAPPTRHVVLKPNFDVEPKPRVRGESNPSKVKPDQPKVKPDQPKVKPDQPKVKPDQPKVKPDEPKVKPDRPKVKPDEPKIKPDQPKVKPDQPKVKPDEPKVKPDKPKVKPDEPKVKPDKPKVKPDKPKAPKVKEK